MTAGTTSPVTAGHIAILIQDLEEGGAQRQMVTLANGFVRLGRRVDVILAEAGGDELIGELSPAIRLFTLGGRRRPDRRKTIGVLATYLAMEKPDVLLPGAAAIHPLAVAAQAPFPDVALLLCASSHPRRPILWTRPRQYLNELVGRRRRARCYARADAIVAVSEAVAAAVRRLAPDVAVRVIHNPVITASFRAGATRPIALPWDSSPDTPLILSVGRVHPAKDFPTLVRAFALLRQSRPARLVIIGDGFAGRGGKEIRALIDRLGIAGDVAMLGPTNAIARVEMTNLIGDEANDWARLAAEPETRLWLYGKAEARPGRKMGHINRLSPLR